MKLEVRVGELGVNGQRRDLLADGDVPEGEFLQWLERLTFHDVPRAVAGFALYVDGKLLKGHDIVLDIVDDPAPKPPAEVTRSGAVEQAERRLQTLRDQANAELDRVRRARDELADLAPQLERERARVYAELVRLDADLAAYRSACLQTKTSAQGDLLETTKQLGSILGEVATVLSTNLTTVNAAFQAQFEVMSGTNTNLLKAEAASATLAAARKHEAQQLALNQLELYSAMEEAGAKQLLASTGPGPKEKLYEGAGRWLGDGGPDRVLSFVGKIFERIADGPPKPA